MKLGFALAAASLLAPATAHAHVCRRDGYSTVAESQRARVLHGHRRYYGCLFDHGRLVRLDRPDVRESLSRFELAGRFVGFAASGSYAAEDYDSVVAQDLRSGNVARSAGAISGFDDSTGQVATLRVTTRGWLAWVACRARACSGGVARQVLRCDSRGRRLLDSGTRIPKDSLQVREHGSRVVWRDAGERRAATLR